MNFISRTQLSDRSLPRRSLVVAMALALAATMLALVGPLAGPAAAVTCKAANNSGNLVKQFNDLDLGFQHDIRSTNPTQRCNTTTGVATRECDHTATSRTQTNREDIEVDIETDGRPTAVRRTNLGDTTNIQQVTLGTARYSTTIPGWNDPNNEWVNDYQISASPFNWGGMGFARESRQVNGTPVGRFTYSYTQRNGTSLDQRRMVLEVNNTDQTLQGAAKTFREKVSAARSGYDRFAVSLGSAAVGLAGITWAAIRNSSYSEVGNYVMGACAALVMFVSQNAFTPYDQWRTNIREASEAGDALWSLLGQRRPQDRARYNG